MKRVLMTDDRPAALTDAQLAQLEALKDRAPDVEDIPEAPADHWEFARRFYKPRKEPISIRLDADILDWLKRKNDRYQTEINRILREQMEREVSGNGRAPSRVPA
jgi:uncharacterized protein (DUF4415 family)